MWDSKIPSLSAAVSFYLLGTPQEFSVVVKSTVLREATVFKIIWWPTWKYPKSSLITWAIFPPQRRKYGCISPDLSLVTMPHNFSLLTKAPLWIVFSVRIPLRSSASLHGYASLSLGIRGRCLTESHFMGPLSTQGGGVNVISNSDGCSPCLSSRDVHEVENAPLSGLRWSKRNVVQVQWHFWSWMDSQQAGWLHYQHA